MSTLWKKTRIGEVCSRVISGGTPSTAHREYYGGDVPWLRTQEIDFNQIFDTEIKITEKGLQESAAKWIPEDSVIVAMYGATAGRAAIAKIPLTTNQACCNLIVDKDKADYYFVYCALKENYRALSGRAKGSAQPNLSAGVIKNFEVSLPPLDIQRRIAGILSDYDTAIANCRKQIVLLEEAVMRLYREWFVAHADSKWEKQRLGDLIEVIESGSRPRGGAVTSGVPSIGAEKIDGVGIYDFANEKFVAEEYFGKMRRGIVADDDVMLYKDGAYAGKVSMVVSGFPHKTAAINEHVFILRTHEKKYQRYLYCLMRLRESYEHFNSVASAKAAQPGLNQDDVLMTEYLMPPQNLIIQFDSIIKPVFTQIGGLANLSKTLTEARDRLLPKLMKGEIEV